MHKQDHRANMVTSLESDKDTMYFPQEYQRSFNQCSCFHMTHKGSRSRRIFKQRMEGRGHTTVSTATFLKIIADSLYLILTSRPLRMRLASISNGNSYSLSTGTSLSYR